MIHPRLPRLPFAASRLAPAGAGLAGLIIGLFLPATSVPAQSAEHAEVCAASEGPLPVLNEGPLRQPFFRALPKGGCPAPGTRLHLHVEAANQFVDLEDGSRSVFLDGETYRIELAATRQLGDGREIRVEVPLRSRSGGFLDGPIERWHDIFGLPQATRRDHPRNRVLFEIADSAGSRTLLRETGSGLGLGDITVRFLQRLTREAGRASVGLRAAVKLPTGSSDELFGSGATDGALGLAATLQAAPPLWIHAGLDVALLGDSPIAGPGLEQARWTSHLALALEWRPWSTTRIAAQLLSESAPLRTGVDEVDRRSLLLAWGLRQVLSPGLEAELAMAEDLRVQTAPDFTIQTGLAWTPR